MYLQRLSIIWSSPLSDYHRVATSIIIIIILIHNNNNNMVMWTVPESVAHVLAGCSSLAQTKYLYRHNAALKILFFELLREHGLIEEVPPWYSPVMQKPTYQNTTSEAFWDIPIYAEHNVSATRGKKSAQLK